MVWLDNNVDKWSALEQYLKNDISQLKNYMYMGSDEKLNHYKHRDTREYIKLPRTDV